MNLIQTFCKTTWTSIRTVSRPLSRFNRSSDTGIPRLKVGLRCKHFDHVTKRRKHYHDFRNSHILAVDGVISGGHVIKYIESEALCLVDSKQKWRETTRLKIVSNCLFFLDTSANNE